MIRHDVSSAAVLSATETGQPSSLPADSPGDGLALSLTPIQLGEHRLSGPVFVAPMAGVTDRPFRQLCKRLGAHYAVSEMAASNPALWHTVKTARRLDHHGETEPRAVQIAGADPAMMAQAARYNVEHGAQIIDINMGCPAKKVCKVAAGSALMGQPALAMAIIDAVVRAVDVPVTLKMRTGPDASRRNAAGLARDAERAGIRMITIHGRTRACGYRGLAEYRTIAEVREAIRIPLVANGDIDGPAKAHQVLRATGADAIMIGRAAQGNPFIFREIAHALRTGRRLAPPTLAEIHQVLREHLLEHYEFHGEFTGVRTARKHVGWTLQADPRLAPHLPRFHALETAEAQIAYIDRLFDGVAANDSDLMTNPTRRIAA
ncbi:MAG: tRNA dihydrouridine synthase DusB [Burkholderiaceae bacterium]